MDNNFLTEDDFGDLLAELEASQPEEDEVEDAETEASRRRYEEIIKKHKND